MPATILLLLLLPLNVFGAGELIINGGLEWPITPEWSFIGDADELVFLSDEGRSGSNCIAFGGLGLEGDGSAHIQQNFAAAVYAHSDLTLWANSQHPTSLVVWIFYEDGDTWTHTMPVTTVEYSQITVPTDKTKPRIATYDESGNIHLGWKNVDDVSMLGGLFVIPEVPLGTLAVTVSMVIALGAFAGIHKRRKL
jgi:hypothetical protein